MSSKKEVATPSCFRYFVAALLPLLILLSMMLRPEAALRMGTAVVIEVRPIDPRDPFRGEYLALELPIQDISLTKIVKCDLSPEDLSRGKTIYVSLTSGSGGIWKVSAVSLKKPGGVYLRGKVLYWSPEALRVDYGKSLNRYFVHEGEAPLLEKILVSGAVADVRILQGFPVMTDIRKK